MRVSSFVAAVFVPALFCSLFSWAQNADTNFASGPQYLMNSGSPLFAQSISTPSLSLEANVPQPSEGETTATVSADDQTPQPLPVEASASDLTRIYYGGPVIEPIEMPGAIAAEARPSRLPASVFDSGVAEQTDLPALHFRGYGITLPEAAAYWKLHTMHASRLYTNKDLEHLSPKA